MTPLGLAPSEGTHVRSRLSTHKRTLTRPLTRPLKGLTRPLKGLGAPLEQLATRNSRLNYLLLAPHLCLRQLVPLH